MRKTTPAMATEYINRPQVLRRARLEESLRSLHYISDIGHDADHQERPVVIGDMPQVTEFSRNVTAVPASLRIGVMRFVWYVDRAISAF